MTRPDLPDAHAPDAHAPEPPPQTHQLYAQYEGTPLWRALEGVVADLVASREVTVGTSPRYVLGYLCQELAAKGVVTGGALTRDR